MAQKTITASSDTPLLLRVRQAAARYDIPKATLYEWAAGGIIPGFVRVGRSVYVHTPTFEAWLERRAQGPQDAAA